MVAGMYTVAVIAKNSSDYVVVETYLCFNQYCSLNLC
jgi:hypothetical protein